MIMKASQLMLYVGIITACSKINQYQRNNLCVQNMEFLNVTTC